MIAVLHGDNQVATRTRLLELKDEFEKKGFSIITLDGKTTEWNQIVLHASSTTLLGEGSAVIVEGYWSLRKGPPTQRASDPEGNVVFWEPKELSKTFLSSFPKEWSIEHFKIPRLAFKFLDTLSPKTTQNSLKMFHQILEHEPAELVLPLIAWHVRQLIWIKESPQTATMPYWKKDKLNRQASLFTKEQLYQLHEQLLKIDRSLKTGSSPLPLSSSLDLLLAQI